MKNISLGIELFNSGNFFDAHDFFEDIWIESEKEEKLFFQGLVQVSVACFHLISGNLTGSLNQLKKAKLKLIGYPEKFNEVNLTALISDVDKLIVSLTKKEFDDNIEKYWKKIPKIN
ncbi:MAG: DUF309 domain-containing protein [Melioribacteraceae bacterium]|nr:DUF309 domain-containing protein [Melioribacteraceae bacterium]